MNVTFIRLHNYTSINHFYRKKTYNMDGFLLLLFINSKDNDCICLTCFGKNASITGKRSKCESGKYHYSDNAFVK